MTSIFFFSINIYCVYLYFQHIVQPKGVRVIRQVIGPAQSSGIGQAGIQPQMYPTIGQTFI
jgi:hypothetical protein